MKVLIWPGRHDLLDGAIKWMTHGAGTHAAFLRASADQNWRLRSARSALGRGAPIWVDCLLDGMRVQESFYPRVRSRPFTRADLEAAEVYELPAVTTEQTARFERLFAEHDGFRHRIRYPIEDLFRYALNWPARDELHGMFCSRYVLYCCRCVLRPEQLPLVRLPVPDWASPRDLRISPGLRPFRWSRVQASARRGK